MLQKYKNTSKDDSHYSFGSEENNSDNSQNSGNSWKNRSKDAYGVKNE